MKNWRNRPEKPLNLSGIHPPLSLDKGVLSNMDLLVKDRSHPRQLPPLEEDVRQLQLRLTLKRQTLTLTFPLHSTLMIHLSRSSFPSLLNLFTNPHRQIRSTWLLSISFFRFRAFPVTQDLEMITTFSGLGWGRMRVMVGSWGF